MQHLTAAAWVVHAVDQWGRTEADVIERPAPHRVVSDGFRAGHLPQERWPLDRYALKSKSSVYSYMCRQSYCSFIFTPLTISALRLSSPGVPPAELHLCPECIFAYYLSSVSKNRCYTRKWKSTRRRTTWQSAQLRIRLLRVGPLFLGRRVGAPEELPRAPARSQEARPGASHP